MTLPSSSAAYTPWDTIEVISNTDDEFTCKRCNGTFALIALVSYSPSHELKKAYPYWCGKCDGPPRGAS